MFEAFLLFAFILGILRLAGITSIAFQALAHLTTAFFLTAGCYDRKNRWKFLGLGLGLTALEVFAFFALKH